MTEAKADQSANRGVKRKRYEPPEEEMSVRVSGKLHHEMKEVHKASKKAKVFETQKVVKRLKDLRKKDESDESIAGFEAELTTLKEIDHDAIGNSALRSKVLKDHTLRDDEDVKAAMTKELESNLVTPAEPGTTLAKIQSRLLSSKILATQVTASMNSLKFLLDPALKQRDTAADTKIDSSTPARSSDRPPKARKETASQDAPTSKQAAASASEDGEDGEADDDGDSNSSREDIGWESGSVDGKGGDNDDGWESGSIGSAPHLEDSEDGESDEDSDSGDEELKVQPKPQKQNPKPTAPSKPTKSSSSKMESTFLPSLSVGFVRGADDSDFSDAEVAAADMPKKNRRGQRARQAIWEKKYGRNANHKKKEAAALAAAPPSHRNKGHARPINTGANAVSSAQAPPGKKVPPGDSGWAGRSKDVSKPVASRPSTHAGPKKMDKNEQKLHPSWEAKRKLKEKESVGIVPSQGKKIKF